LQIWILPHRAGVQPGYEQKAFPEADKRGRLRLVASPDGRDGSVTIHADAALYAGLFDGVERHEQPLDPARPGYVFVARGSVAVNGQALQAGDALTLRDEARLVIESGHQAEVLVFDLAR
jgi:redox-sensitive bicupin YhaK (pirin superfamily)